MCVGTILPLRVRGGEKMKNKTNKIGTENKKEKRNINHSTKEVPMKFLVAQLNADNRWSKVAVYRRRSSGSISLPMKYNGNVEGHLFRSGANSLNQDPAINWVEVQYGSSPTYRISRA